MFIGWHKCGTFCFGGVTFFIQSICDLIWFASIDTFTWCRITCRNIVLRADNTLVVFFIILSNWSFFILFTTGSHTFCAVCWNHSCTFRFREAQIVVTVFNQFCRTSCFTTFFCFTKQLSANCALFTHKGLFVIYVTWANTFCSINRHCNQTFTSITPTYFIFCVRKSTFRASVITVI